MGGEPQRHSAGSFSRLVLLSLTVLGKETGSWKKVVQKTVKDPSLLFTAMHGKYFVDSNEVRWYKNNKPSPKELKAATLER